MLCEKRVEVVKKNTVVVSLLLASVLTVLSTLAVSAMQAKFPSS